MEQPSMTILDFVLELMDDPQRLVSFREDPEGALAESPLNERQKAVLRSGDALRIQHVIEYESGIERVAFIIVIFFAWDQSQGL